MAFQYHNALRLGRPRPHKADTQVVSCVVKVNSVRLNFCMVAELSDATVRDG